MSPLFMDVTKKMHLAGDQSRALRHDVTVPWTSISWEMGVSKNRGTPKTSILIGFSIINHPFWGTPIFGNTQTNQKNATNLFAHCTPKPWFFGDKFPAFHPKASMIIKYDGYHWLSEYQKPPKNKNKK